MSILNVNELNGPEWSDFKILMEGNNHLNVNGVLQLSSTSQFAIPCGTTAERPGTPSAGMIRYNTDYDIVEVYNGTNWFIYPKGSLINGESAETAAPSAAYLYNNGIVTSGKGLYWIETADGGAQEVFCDFDTLDEDGNSGWMLVASFEEGRYWGGKNNNITTTRNTIGSTASGYNVSANFGNQTMRRFRVTANPSITGDLGSSALADWYYNWDDTIRWKEVWSPSAGVTNHYLSRDARNAANTAVQRTCIRKFQGSYNIKYSYAATTHIYNNITDYGYQGTAVAASGYEYGVVGVHSSAPASGFFDVWSALTSPGAQFEWFYVGRNGGYSARTGPDSDGTLGIICQGSTQNLTGQDMDTDISAKVGNDDNGDWGAAASAADSCLTSSNGVITSQPLWWWIK